MTATAGMTPHAFSRRLLRDYPFDAGVDPRFSVIGIARQRALAVPILDELIEARREHTIIRLLTEAMDADEFYDALLSFYRRTRQEQIELPKPNDPAPFLEAFTRTYAEMLAATESPDDALGPLIEQTRPDLAKAMEWAAHLMRGEHDWKAFRVLWEFRGHFRPEHGNPDAGQLTYAARHALTGFLDACLDCESIRWSEVLLDLVADFHDAYTSAKDDLGALDFDDLLIKAEELLGRHPEIARRYPDKPSDAEQESPREEISALIRRACNSCDVEIVCLPESYTAGERHLIQSEFIAQRVAGLVGEGTPPEDIGILVRSSYDAHFYERKLAEYGIESGFIGRRPLSESPGAREIISLLGQEDLGPMPLRSALSRFAGRCLTMPDGLQRYANARRLIELAENDDLADLIAQAQEMEITRDSIEGVRIMPIHNACDLPVAFIADTGRSLDLNPGLFAFHPDRGLATWVVNPTTGRFSVPLVHREISEVIRSGRMQRERDILATALTRASNRLILVGCSNLRGDQGLAYSRIYSWSGWIEKALDLGPSSPEGEISFNGCRFTLTTDPPIKTSLPMRNTLASRFAAEFREGRPIEGVEIPPSVLTAVVRCLLPPTPVVPVSTRISVSQALDYIECPARYRLLHIIGMPEEGGEPSDDREEPEISAADLGHEVHDLLSRLDFSRDIRPQVEGYPLLEQFADTCWVQELRAADKVLKEVPFEIPISPMRPIGPMVLSGRMDVFYHGPRGWVVLDYKTGRAETRERYELQVGVYAHVIQRLIGEMPSQAALVLLSLGEDWVQDTSDGTIAAAALARLLDVCSSIDSGLFDPRPSKACDWCSFKGACAPYVP